jgi:hypothetical protein
MPHLNNLLLPLTVYPLDEGRIIAIVPTTNDRVILLETATMSQVLSIPTQESPWLPPITPSFFAPRLKTRSRSVALKERARRLPADVEFSHQRPRWTVRTRTPIRR